MMEDLIFGSHLWGFCGKAAGGHFVEVETFLRKVGTSFLYNSFHILKSKYIFMLKNFTLGSPKDNSRRR